MNNLTAENQNRNRRPLGFSSSFLSPVYSGVSKEVVKMCQNMGCDAIELHCLPEEIDRFDKLFELTSDDLNDFQFISFHAPLKGKKEKEITEIIEKIGKLHNSFHFDAVVVHADLFENQNLFKSFNLPFSVENMDNQKKSGRTLESMKEIMSRNDFKVTLDINHAFVNDPTLKLAQDLWREFKDRISHFHLSGFKSQGLHDPLVQTKQIEFIDFVFDKNLPIIIESFCQNLAQAKAEFNFIKSSLARQSLT